MKSLRKESKDFARVGWILDYGLRFREEEGKAGGENKDYFGWETTTVEKALRTGLAKDDEDRKHSKRNAPD